MLELRTLGSLDLRDAEGREHVRVLAQSKRLALLVYLAVMAPRGYPRRDTLVALFWPHLDTRHARNALCQSVYTLRRHLGTGAVVNRGPEELGVRPERVCCDVVAFEAALEAGRPAEALSHYRGGFLEGFHVSQAPEFEGWLLVERERLRHRAVEAASMLADRAEAAGRLEQAADWLRRALEISPTDELVLRRLVFLLSQAGDRAGAVRAYEEFARRLLRDHDLEPSPQTLSLIESVRDRRNVSGG